MDNYTANDIETLNFKDAVRKRIEMYLGSADNSGVIQCIREVITNSIDEYTMGYGHEIRVELFPNNKISIRDWARGTPFGKREDGSEALIATFMMPHTGGKFSQKTYQNAAGMNGIGVKGVALSASDFQVDSIREGRQATLILNKGKIISYDVTDTKEKNGTIITFTPDQEVYRLEKINIDFNLIKQICKDWSYLTKGLKFVLMNHVTKEKVEYLTDNGITDLLRDTVKTPVHSKPLYHKVAEDGITVEIAIQWTKGREKSYIFTNGLFNSAGGTSLTGAKTAITRTVNNLIDKSLTGDMARTGLVYIVNAQLPNASFSDQTKTKVNNPELRSMADRAISEAIKQFAQGKPEEFNKVRDFLVKEEKAEIAAERARQAVLNHTKEMTDARKKKFIVPDKLKDAEKLGQDSILLVVEGDSAAGSMTQARDTEHYGVLALRGKVINTLSNSIEDILENEEVKLFLVALGVNINNYRPQDLRYGKVAICVDADSDGAHIACLIMALVWKLIPEFLKENRLYWLKAPLFLVKKGGKNYYYYDDDEMMLGVKGITVRYKGLGEINASEVEESMFNLNNQRMEQLTYTEEGTALLEELMGRDVEPRREFVSTEVDFTKYGEV